MLSIPTCCSRLGGAGPVRGLSGCKDTARAARRGTAPLQQGQPPQGSSGTLLEWGKPPCMWIWNHLYFLPFLSPSLLFPLSQPQPLVLQDFMAVWGGRLVCFNVKP